MKYTIKPLEWRKIGGEWIEENSTHGYIIEKIAGRFYFRDRKSIYSKHSAPANSLTEAKEACQKHWEEQLKQYLVEVE